MIKVNETFFSGKKISRRQAANTISSQVQEKILPVKNLGTYSTTKMDYTINKIICNHLGFNAINKNEYKFVTNITDECLEIFYKLFNVSKHDNPIGISTVGSSEAVMLAGLNLKLLWLRKKKENNNIKPNIIVSQNAHLVWKKFASYFDIEARIAEVNEHSILTKPKSILNKIDENTIGVCCTLGNTYTGGFDPIEEINNNLIEFYKKFGINVYIHVDAASGGFVTPFKFPKIKWDFRLSQVISVNVSSHKYGYTYPAAGWLVFKDRNYFCDNFNQKVPYLSGSSNSFEMNFSKPVTNILAQYYNFFTLGMHGYKKILERLYSIKDYITKELQGTPFVEILEQKEALPVIIFWVKNYPFYTEVLCQKLEQYGWSIPVYNLPNGTHDVARIVLRREMTFDLAKQLIKNIKEIFNREFHYMQTIYLKPKGEKTCVQK